MFRKAIKIAREFTLPVIISRKTWDGKCSSTLGTFVVVNDEGWIVTAGHIMSMITQLSQETALAVEHEAKRLAIENNGALTPKDRSKALAQLGKPKPDSTRNCSVFWGGLRGSISDISMIPTVDLGIGRLDNFDPTQITTFPIFKDPAKDFEPGTSLCKLGFPFHNINPTWDEQNQGFMLPAGAFPVPMFPIDGIFTRTVTVGLEPGVAPPPFPLQWVETSSPGLKGQSGGPTFDVNGSIWSIQCITSHYALGFNPPVPGSRNGEKEHQFLNVGMGVHAETIFGLFKQVGVKYQMSAY
jgi:hypothetical protein